MEYKKVITNLKNLGSETGPVSGDGDAQSGWWLLMEEVQNVALRLEGDDNGG